MPGYSPWNLGSRGGPARRPGVAPQMEGTPRPAAPNPNASGDFFAGPGRTEGSYNAGAAGSSGAAPGWAADTIRNRYTDALNRTGSVGERAENTYLDRAEGFNAQDYVKEAAQGAWNNFRPQLQQDIGELRGQQVGMGRLDTGFGTEDEDRLVTTSMDRLNNTVASQALQGGALQLRNDQGLGDFGSEYGNRYLDLISGQYDRKTAETNAKKGKFWEDLGGVADLAGSAAMFL